MRPTRIIPIAAFLVVFATVSFFGYRTFSKKETREQPKKEITSSALKDKRLQTAQAKIAKFPELASGYNQLAAVYMQIVRETGDISLNSKAEEALNIALEKEPNNYDSLKLKTKFLLSDHRFEEALELARSLEKTHESDSDIYGALTDANVELGNYEDAVKAAQRMNDLRPDTASYARVSHLRSLHGDTVGAIEATRFAAKIADPKDKEAAAWCLVKIGDELFQAGKYVEAEKEYDNALSIFPDYYLGLTAKARARAAIGDYTKAIEFYKHAQERVMNVETVIALGNIYAKIGNKEEAKKQYELAVVIEEKYGADDEHRLALLWADNDVKLDDALEIALREKKTHKDIFTADILAWCLFKKGRYQEAKTAIDEAMRLKTKNARIFYHAGMIANALGNRKEAVQYLQLALKTNPAFDILQADKARQVLESHAI